MKERQIIKIKIKKDYLMKFIIIISSLILVASSLMPLLLLR
jgi:hypothetical protein